MADHDDAGWGNHYEANVRSIDERVARAQISDESKFTAADDQVQKLWEGLSTERISREILDERKTKELKLIESTMTIDVNVLKQTRKDTSLKVDKQIDMCVENVKEVLKQERTSREASQESYYREIGEEICKLYSEIERERQTRIEKGERVAGAIEKEFEKIRDAVGAEKKIRCETENTMLQMLEDMCVQIQKKVANERMQREQSQEELLRLLEETCSRVEGTCRRVEDTPGYSPRYAITKERPKKLGFKEVHRSKTYYQDPQSVNQNEE